jgi:hypothetical protein
VLPRHALLLSALLLPSLARAADPAVTPIWNGAEAGPCDWPSIVQMEDSCSGTLVHPEVVIYAGHCGDDYAFVNFGEGGDNLAFSVETEFCVSSGFDIGHDYAVCKLKEPVLNVPIVPILMGCETEALKVDGAVTMIGFGEAEAPKPYGIKRVAHSIIRDFADNEIFIQSDDGMDTCFGDSGGPVMIQLGDGTWRVFGITSYGVSDQCGTGTWYSMMHIDLAWFEDNAGVDITPCHTADGVWDPGPACGGFPEDPGTGVGAWDSCGSGPVGDLSATCGMAFGSRPDDAPPLAEVTFPETGLEFMAVDKLPLTITGTARDAADKPDGWGVDAVHLVLNDQQLPNSVRLIPPYAWDVQLPTGQYIVQLLAVDKSMNEGLSPPVAIGVNMPPPPLPDPDPTTGDVDSDSDGGSGSGSDDTTTTTVPTDPGQDPDASSSEGGGSSESTGALGQTDDTGCGCTTTTFTRAPPMLALLLLVRRRRVARVARTT